MKNRSGFSLIELIVVLAVLALLMALLAPAVFASIERARNVTCKNRLRQLGVAIVNFDGANNRMPPGLETYQQPGTSQIGYGFAWHLLLPNIGETTLWNQSCAGSAFCSVDNNRVREAKVSLYRCPQDDTDRGAGTVRDNLDTLYGASSYSGNALLFAVILTDGVFPQFVSYSRPVGDTLSKVCRDGLSNTVLVTEKVAVCGRTGPYRGGAAWAYHEQANQAFPYYAAVALPWGPNAGTGPTTHFQVLTTPDGECDPREASTRHQDGIPVLWADGHVSTLGRSFDQSLWWPLLTPDNGEVTSTF